MNIIEAIKSGKDFKRKIWSEDSYVYVTNIMHFRLRDYKNERVILDHDDVIADDWEVSE